MWDHYEFYTAAAVRHIYIYIKDHHMSRTIEAEGRFSSTTDAVAVRCCAAHDGVDHSLLWYLLFPVAAL